MKILMVPPERLELPKSCFLGMNVYQFHQRGIYILVSVGGFEPPSSCFQGKPSNQADNTH